ncbi:Ankyrin Repeat Domain-Containing Protein 11, partial [Manis pentadactyla]
ALAPGGQQGGAASHHLSQSQDHVGVSGQASRAQALSHWLGRARGQDKRALGQGRSIHRPPEVLTYPLRPVCLLQNPHRQDVLPAEPTAVPGPSQVSCP